MCGIVALISTGKQPLDEAVPGVEKALDNALDRIQHRGPDGRGIWVSDDRKVALAHCRLSINDLSPSGSQPLHSPSGIHTVVNGELYDYAPLRSSLEARGYTFTSGSDSELVLYLYEEYGLDFVQYLRGEFAIVLLDARKGKERSVVVRDRYGIKPMFVRYVQDGAQSKDENKDLAQGGYVTGEKQGGAVLMFAAEMKAFLELGWKPEWDVGAIATGAWGQDTRTVFKGVHKLRPAHMMVIEDGKIDTKVYWDASYPDKFVSQETAWLRPVADAQTYKDPRSEEEMVLQTRSLLIDSVAQRLRADVPIGIYLSGGIDSSALAGIADHLVREKGLSMGTPIAPTSSQNPSSSHSEAEAAAEAHKSRICCFSIAFDLGSGHDESSVARRTADHLGVRFITQHMDEQALADAFEEAVYSCEHHNHDLNFVGKHALSRLPREYGYKVVLTGEGADEHFGGYPLYFPDYLSEVDASNGLGDDERVELRDRLVKERADGYDFGGANGEYMRTHPSARPSGHLPLYTPGAMLAFTPLSTILSPAALSAFSPSADDSLRMIANNISPAAQGDIKDKWHPLNSAMYVWGKGHLANQFLSCLGDRVEMAHSVEARTPFLDHRLAEHVNGLPVGMKVRVTRTKDDGDGEGEGEGPEEKLEKDVQASLDQAPGAGAHANGIAQPDGANKATPNGVTATSKSDPIFTEKYALREAVKPFVTPEVYTRTKYPYSAPSVYPANGPVNTLLNKLVTKERIEQLGWVNWDVVGKMKEQAWTCEEHPKGSKEQGEAVRAWRQVLMLAEWTVLAERFGVETWMSDQWSDH